MAKGTDYTIVCRTKLQDRARRDKLEETARRTNLDSRSIANAIVRLVRAFGSSSKERRETDEEPCSYN